MHIALVPLIPQEVLEQISTDLALKGRADVLFVIQDGEVKIKRITDDQHCVTCQCNRVSGEMPLDKNGKPRKRSWHTD